MRISDWSSDVCSSDLDERRNILHLSMSATDKHSTALHEVQHAIQKIEDMGRGGDPDPDLRRMSADHLQDPLRNVIECDKLGRAACRERVCHYVYLSVVAVCFTKQMYIIHFNQNPPCYYSAS